MDDETSSGQKVRSDDYSPCNSRQMSTRTRIRESASLPRDYRLALARGK